MDGKVIICLIIFLTGIFIATIPLIKDGGQNSKTKNVPIIIGVLIALAGSFLTVLFIGE